jgi:hypothetical protein
MHSTLFRVLLFVAIVFLPGCVSPAPTRFVDVPEGRDPKSYRAFAEGNRLIIEVRQQSGFNLASFKTSRHEDSFYIFPYYISSGGARTQTFTIDLTPFNPPTNWPEQTYWYSAKRAYPILSSGFWDASKRELTPRTKINIERR